MGRAYVGAGSRMWEGIGGRPFLIGSPWRGGNPFEKGSPGREMGRTDGMI